MKENKELSNMHAFTLQFNWDNGRNGTGLLAGRNGAVAVSVPKEMGGPDIGTNPDEMLLGAAATCYGISLAAMLEASNVQASLHIVSYGYIEEENRVLTYRKIVHAPHVILFDATKERIVRRLVQKAEASCMISRALAGNVTILIEEHIEIEGSK